MPFGTANSHGPNVPPSGGPFPRRTVTAIINEDPNPRFSAGTPLIRSPAVGPVTNTIRDVIARRRETHAAARNNAEWCDIVCRTHGIPGRFDPDAWVNQRRTPRYYPDAVSLDPAAVASSILERVDTTSIGCSIKDSFATLDLAPFGFRVAHEAEWIHRGPQASPVSGPGDMTWRPIETADSLVAWDAAWDVDGDSEHLFRPVLLQDPAVRVLGGYVDGSIVAGAITNRTGHAVVGLSNVFTTDGDLDHAWTGCLAYLDAAFPGMGVVGYESGGDLSVAIRQGFRSVGALRIWLQEA